MGKSRLFLQIPADHTITINLAGNALDSLLHGQLLFTKIPVQCDIQIILARVGRLKYDKETRSDTASKRLLDELGLLGPQKEQRLGQFDYDTAEKLSGCLISQSQAPSRAKTVKCEFNLQIPSYLPPTTALPSVDVSYAVFATCVLPNSKVLRTCQGLRIVRENINTTNLEPSRTVSFPETTFTIRASFETPDLSSKNVAIPTTLQLNGLQLPLNESMRLTETRWLVPREMKWDLEETAIIITGIPDATGHIPMSTAQRTLKKRTLATGREKFKLKYPFTRSGNTPVKMLPDNTGMNIPFTATAPKDISLGDSTALSVAGGHIMHTVLSCETPLDTNLPRKRFSVYLEYKLHIWLRIGEDVFDKASGDLTNRKMDEMAYTLVCPLKTQKTPTAHEEEPAPVIPPSYDGVWEQPPPDYTTYS